jgi:hypothetical protein
MGVAGGRRGRRLLQHRTAIEAVFEDRFNTLVRTGPERERPAASGFKALGTIAFSQPHDAQTGPEPLLRMGPRGEKSFHDLRGRATALGCPPDQPLWRPGRVVPVGFRHVRRDRTVTALAEGALVARHPFALVEDFHHLGTQANRKLLLDQRVGHRVVMAIDFEVIIDVAACEFPLRICIRPSG